MKLNKEELQQFFSIVDAKCQGNYHDIYKKLGFKKGPSGTSFHCPNTTGHSNNDRNASMSIDNDRGVINCFACGYQGNLSTVYKDFFKQGAKSYVDFMIDLLGLNELSFVKEDTKITKAQSDNLSKVYDDLMEEIKKSGKKTPILNDTFSDMIKESVYIDKTEMNAYCEALLASPVHLQYLKQTRNVSIEFVREYKIGLTGNSFSIPILAGSGDLINIKLYNPECEKFGGIKWMYKYKNAGSGPFPIKSLAKDVIYICEGEPDVFTLLCFGFEGSITLGGKGQTDVVKAFGKEACEMHLPGKEIVIIMDADEQSEGSGEKIARAIYQFNPRQIKIIDLNKSEINPNGLDPAAMKIVKKGSTESKKRLEKDVTEFFVKNGFNSSSHDIFVKLIEDTKAYSLNKNRSPIELSKVSLQESRSPKYFSHDGSKRLEVVVTISDFDESAYMYDKKFSVSCICMNAKDGKLMPQCRKCILPSLPGFNSSPNILFEFALNGTPTITKIVISANDMLELIETNNREKLSHQKTLCGIDSSCRLVKITPDEQEKVVHTRMSKEACRYGDVTGGYNNSDIQVDGYIIGTDVSPGKSYRMRGIQTKDPNTQRAVLVIDEVEQIATQIDNFKMSQETHEILRGFRPKPGESIKDHFKRRYDVLSARAGVTGRHEVFHLLDMAFFSQIEIKNKLFPTMNRGWVEVLIVGESRSGKTMIAKYLNSLYRVADMLSGSSSVTRSGLLGGIKIFKGRQRISWGSIVQNDGQMVIIDELSNVTPEILSDMTSARSEGIFRIDGIEKGAAPARTRKAMLSNPRGDHANKKDLKGVDMLLQVCVQKQILARFDAALYIMADDVLEFEHKYEDKSEDFLDYACRTLVMWGHSRGVENVVYEEGIEEALNYYQDEMLKKYHRDTQLVNQEYRFKLLRGSEAVAGMLYSTLDDDWNKLYVKKEHVKHANEFFDMIYCYPNMRLDEFSRQRRRAETLGNMSFMENILRYINIKDLINENEFSQTALQQVFFDYLDKVQAKRLFMVDAKSDSVKSTGTQVHLGIQKLIATLISRNCMIRRGAFGYRKTEQFTNWLLSMEDKNETEFSDILEPFSNEHDSKVIQAFKESHDFSRTTEKRQNEG